MTGRLRMTLVAGLATFLSSLSMWSLVRTERWPYLALVAIALVGAVGWLTRRFRVPGLLAFLASLVALVLLLTFLFARENALLGVLPTPATVHDVGRLFLSGLYDVRRFATPARESQGILFFLVGGIGLVAVFVDLLAVRLRQPAVAGLPMLALFSVSAGILKDGPGWLPFLLAALGFLGLLLADGRQRLARWGRPVLVRRPWERPDRAGRTETADTAPIASLGRRIGFTAVLVAVLLPALVPMTDQSFAGGSGRDGLLSRLGAPTLRTRDPLVTMRQDLLRTSNRPILRYTSTTANPDYLRTAALTEFDGESWQSGRLRGYDQYSLTRDTTIVPPTGTDASQLLAVRSKIKVLGTADLAFLPAPYAPQQVDAEGSWYYDPSTLTLFSPDGVRSTDGMTYTVLSQEPRPRPSALQVTGEASAVHRGDLSLPGDLPAAIHQRAEEVTAGRTTRYEKAVALQRWFTDTGNFTYSTQVASGTGTNAVMQFLRDRRGFCEQYASAMAVMARTLGIPARVAVGFTRGERTGSRSWVVRGHDAHAWPELWFEGVGWIRFEPTPVGADGQGSAVAPRYTEDDALRRDPGGDQEADPTSITSSASGGASGGRSTFRERNLSQSSVAASGGSGGGGISGPALLVAALVLLVLVLLVLLPAAVRRVASRRRWARARDPAALAHAGWAELRDHLHDLGVPTRPGDTPRSTALALTRRLGADTPAAAAVRRITLAEERARYAERPDTPPNLRRDVHEVRGALAASVPRAARWRARWLPRSVTTRLRSAFGRLGSRYDELDLATGRYVGRLVPRRFRTRRT